MAKTKKKIVEKITTTTPGADEQVVAGVEEEVTEAEASALDQLIEMRKTGGLRNRDRAIQVLADVVLGLAGEEIDPADIVDPDAPTPDGAASVG